MADVQQYRLFINCLIRCVIVNIVPLVEQIQDMDDIDSCI